MKWVFATMILLVAMAMVAAFGVPDVDMDANVFTLDFDSAAMTEQVRLRENGETQRLGISEAAETRRHEAVQVTLRFFAGAVAIIAVAFVVYRLQQPKLDAGAGSQRALLPAVPEQVLPEDVQRQFVIVLNRYGDGYVDVDDGEWVFVQPHSKTVVPLAPVSSHHRLPGPT
ncbi:MAG TPA: hypothetical protein PL187_23805 [Caldilinea sp.]|nr:hypothetical protein [Caldilinea sp.]